MHRRWWVIIGLLSVATMATGAYLTYTPGQAATATLVIGPLSEPPGEDRATQATEGQLASLPPSIKQGILDAVSSNTTVYVKVADADLRGFRLTMASWAAEQGSVPGLLEYADRIVEFSEIVA
jgi:hypothetical protein